MRLSIHSPFDELLSDINNRTGKTIIDNSSENVTVKAVTNPNC